MVGTSELFKEAPGQGLGLTPEPGVECGLPAAGLTAGEVEFDAEPPQEADCALSDIRGELVNDTGYEKGGSNRGRTTAQETAQLFCIVRELDTASSLRLPGGR